MCLASDVEPGLDQALVPHLLLQPIVENAVRHGVANTFEPVEIRLSARRDSGALVLSVDNNGPRIRADALPGRAGIGLANVRERLRACYGEAGTLDASASAGGRLPRRDAPAAGAHDVRKLRVLTVDDEPLALQRLAWSLAEFPYVELVGEARSGREALELVRALRPNLLMLDIDMPPPGGLDVVAALDSNQPLEVVFVTAFDEFAVRAFELSATDYLLKPVVHARLERALARSHARLDARESDSRVAELKDVVEQLRKARHAPAEARYVTEFGDGSGRTGPHPGA